MKDFQRMYKKLNVNSGETQTLIISRTEAINNKFAFVFSGIDAGNLSQYAKIWILAGAADQKVNLTDCSDLILNCGSDGCILTVNFPIVSDIEISITGPSNGLSLGVHAGND